MWIERVAELLEIREAWLRDRDGERTEAAEKHARAAERVLRNEERESDNLKKFLILQFPELEKFEPVLQEQLLFLCRKLSRTDGRLRKDEPDKGADFRPTRLIVGKAADGSDNRIELLPERREYVSSLDGSPDRPVPEFAPEDPEEEDAWAGGEYLFGQLIGLKKLLYAPLKEYRGPDWKNEIAREDFTQYAVAALLALSLAIPKGQESRFHPLGGPDAEEAETGME